MKKILIVLAALTAASAIGCKENIEQPEPEIGFSLGRNIVEMPASGGEATVTWSTDNPIEGMNVELGGDIPEWINNFNTSENGKIAFNVDSTDIEVDTREARILVNYGEDTASFKVVQAGLEAAYELSVERISPASVLICINGKNDEQLNNYYNVIEKGIWEEYSSDEELFADDMAALEYLAEQSRWTLEEYLKFRFEWSYYTIPYMLVTDGVLSNEIRSLRPDTEYVVYTYDISAEGEVLSNVYHEEFATTSFNWTDNTTFDIDVKVNGTKVSADIRPSDKNARYNAEIISNAEMAVAPGGIPEDEDLAIHLQQRVDADVFFIYGQSLQTDNPAEWSEVVNALFRPGDKTIEKDWQLADASGIVAVYPLDDNGVLSGKPVYKTFKTDDIEMSDNIIEMNISNIESRYATLEITTTNDDPYSVMFCQYKAEYEGLSDEELISAVNRDGTALLLGQGNTSKKIENLHRDTEYMLVAYGYDKGKITTTPVTKRFTTATPVISDVKCELVVDKYFYAADAIEKYPERFSHLTGIEAVIVPVSAELTGNPEAFFYRQFLTSQLPEHDDDIISMLERMQPCEPERYFELILNSPMVFVAVARDSEGNYGEVYCSEEFVFTKEGCSPIDELVIE